MHLAASLAGFEVLLSLASGFPEAQSITSLFGALGSFAGEKLAETVEDGFVAISFDFATILSSSFCSCILFALVLEQLFKLASGAEMADVKQMKKIVPFVTCEIAFWSKCLRVDVWCQCIESEFLDSRIILSNNQSKATLWVPDTCLIVGLRPFIII